MTQIRVTQHDLEWWYEFAAAHEWTFAKTYAQSAPHDYVVAGRTPGVTHADLVRAAHVIHTFGRPGKYYSVTKIYLESADGRHRWWTEDDDLADTNLVNRATTDVVYGIQNAPTTESGIASPFNELATSWDAAHPVTTESVQRAREQVADLRGKYPPHVLDIGCGTGRVLDLGLVSPDRYAGVDSSRAMLNMLVRKYPRVAAVYPADVRELLQRRAFTPGQFDLVFLDAAARLTRAEVSRIEQLARVALIVTDGVDVTVQDLRDAAEVRA